MKKFNVDLIEDHYGCYFSIDSLDRKEYTLRKRTGLLKRNFDQQWSSNSLELESVAEAANHLEQKLNLKGYKNSASGITFQPAKLLKEHRQVIDFLHTLDTTEWKVVFRTQNTQRLIIKNNGREKKNSFFYSSIMIKIRPTGNGVFFEVGEGIVQGGRFNRDGIISRINDILRNHREKKNISFNDKVPVILGAGDGAILFHEILGHALEADYIYGQRSPFSIDDLGRQIMPSFVTVSAWDKKDLFFKEITCDDEGETIKNPLLIENGVLKNFVSDSFYKNLLNIKCCGHSRVVDFARLPMPRMYGIYVKPGKYSPEELIASTPYGVYAKEFGEGKIDFDRNLFYFHISDARLIERGKRTAPLGPIVVRGQITEVLNSVEMIADDFRYDKGTSYCHKNNQTLNVRVGQPTVKVTNLYVTRDSDD